MDFNTGDLGPNPLMSRSTNSAESQMSHTEQPNTITQRKVNLQQIIELNTFSSLKAKGCPNTGKKRGKNTRIKKKKDPEPEKDSCCGPKSGSCSKRDFRAIESCCESGTCKKEASDACSSSGNDACSSGTCDKQIVSSKDSCCDTGVCTKQSSDIKPATESCCVSGTCNKQSPNTIKRDSCCDEKTGACKQPEKLSDCASKGCCGNSDPVAQSHNQQEREIELDTSDQDLMLVAFTVQGMVSNHAWNSFENTNGNIFPSKRLAQIAQLD